MNTFVGQGTLYLSGTFLVAANTKLCAKVATGGADCDMAGWNPGQAMLIVLANGSGGQVTAGYSAQISNSAAFQGGLYATAAISIGSSAQVKGPLIATTVIFGTYSQTYPYGPLATMPAGTPGATSSSQVSAPEGFSG